MNAPSASDRWPFATDQRADQDPYGRPQQHPQHGQPPQYRTPGQPARGPVGQAQQVPHQRVQPAAKPAVGRRMLGVLAFVVLTGLSLPVHVMAVFFVYLLIESPGDAGSAVLLACAAFLGSFGALFVTGTLSQIAGGFPGRWRARVTFAALSGLISLGLAYLAALTLF